jgi:hypothetical protein
MNNGIENNGIKNGLQERKSGTMSSRKPLSLVVSLILSGIVACGGASASTAPRVSEVRSLTVIKAGAPQVLVEGPARLLHVEFESAKMVSLYSVASNGPDACRAGAADAKRTVLHTNIRNALNLNVPAGQTVCLVANGGSIDVVWHAEKDSVRERPVAIEGEARLGGRFYVRGEDGQDHIPRFRL